MSEKWQTTSEPYGQEKLPVIPRKGMVLPRRFVLLESPFAGNEELHVQYARSAMLDSLQRGEAPFASHLLYPQVLDDRDPAERRMGIEAGLAIGKLATASVFYTDLGMSKGMQQGYERAVDEGRAVEFRSLEKLSSLRNH